MARTCLPCVAGGTPRQNAPGPDTPACVRHMAALAKQPPQRPGMGRFMPPGPTQRCMSNIPAAMTGNWVHATCLQAEV
eukprot:364299-Chlamydomonas_euryale.AAC.9